MHKPGHEVLAKPFVFIRFLFRAEMNSVVKHSCAQFGPAVAQPESVEILHLEACPAGISFRYRGEPQVYFSLNMSRDSQGPTAVCAFRRPVPGVISGRGRADGLSRDGLLDEWTCKQDWQVTEVPVMSWQGLFDKYSLGKKDCRQ